MIELHEVVKRYQRGGSETLALAGVSLHVPKGEFVSVMGPSGSGKSTLLHLVGALDTPSAGHVKLNNQDVSLMTDNALTLFRRKNLGFIFQFFNLLPTMSATENAALPAMLNGASDNVAFAKARELLTRVGLGHRLDHRPDQLSGGEMQRVAIARALVNEPVLVLADEPTGNLDSTTGVEVLKILRQATREQGVTLIMVTHDKNAASVGDRIVTLKDGRVVSDKKNETAAVEPIALAVGSV